LRWAKHQKQAGKNTQSRNDTGSIDMWYLCKRKIRCSRWGLSLRRLGKQSRRKE